MRIAALSDFHIGSTDQADCFRHREDDFLRFLDDIEGQHDKVVLLGDIFQTEHGWNHSSANEAKELARARQRVPALCRRFAQRDYYYVFGNHDKIAQRETGAVESITFSDHGFTAVFIHGHQFDPLLNRVYPLARGSTWLSGRLRHAGLRTLPDWLEHQDIVIKHRRFGGQTGPYADGARNLATAQGANAVIMGHTHMPQRTSLDGNSVFANTGTCSLGQGMYVSVDTRAGSVTLCRYGTT